MTQEDNWILLSASTFNPFQYHVAFGKLQVVRVWEGKGQIISYYYYKCNFYIMELLKIYPVSSKVSRVHFENTKFIVSFPLWVMVGWLGITNKYSTHIHIYTPCIFYKNYNFSGNYNTVMYTWIWRKTQGINFISLPWFREYFWVLQCHLCEHRVHYVHMYRSLGLYHIIFS